MRLAGAALFAAAGVNRAAKGLSQTSCPQGRKEGNTVNF